MRRVSEEGAEDQQYLGTVFELREHLRLHFRTVPFIAVFGGQLVAQSVPVDDSPGRKMGSCN